MQYKDYYKIMGVPKTAKQDEIKRAYRKLARKFHPDVSKEPNAETKFKELGEAYEVLKDPQKRAAYDRMGTQWRDGQNFTPPPNWDAGFEFSGGSFTGGDATGFSDFFESLFGRSSSFGFNRSGGARQAHTHGEDHYAKILIDLEDAYNGVTRSVSLQHPDVDAEGHVINKARKLNVKIPKGVIDGQQIRLVGQGGAGTGRGRTGDLFLEITFRPHPLYQANGRDIFLDLPITPWESSLGATIKVPTLGGHVDLKIPAGSQSGDKLRLKARGLPGTKTGDQYVLLKIVTPPATTEQQKDFYQNMAKLFPMNPRTAMGV
ncbi:MAG: DnaJ domain-containing protein [Methylococcaceae bacterium]|nr:DnaJ domain-containing protein [Methylococcaceae bacterium]